MPRSPSLPLAYDESSSLDPLVESFAAYTSPAATRSSSPAKRRPLSPIKSSTRKRSSIDRKSTQSPPSVSIVAQSPSRTVTEQTLSPWKIRVTVETEPEDADGPMEMTTRTTKIPLRQVSSPTPAEPSSGRGRKSQSGTARSKRSGTPVRGRNNSRSRSRRPSVTDLDIVVLGDDGDNDEWTGKRKRPRKRRASNIGREKSASVGPEDAMTMNNGREDPRKFEIHQDDNDGIALYDEPEQPSTESPELRQIDLNRVSVRPRAQSTRQKEELGEPGLKPTVQYGSSPKPIKSSSRKVSANSAVSYPTPSPTSSYHGGSDEVDKDPNPTSQHEVFDTILESEEFTMIDLSSVPSAKQFLSTPPDSNGTDTDTAVAHGQALSSDMQRQTSHIVHPSPIPKHMATVDEESELSSNVPSSPPALKSSMLQVPPPSSGGLRKVTPMQYSSPKLPSPPRQMRKSPAGHQRTMSKEAVSAGMALQGIVSPERNVAGTLSSSSSQLMPSSVEEELYSGFSSGTKRELRAGLRFGEELAKRQKSRSSGPAAPQQPFGASSKTELETRTKPTTSTQVWRGETLVRHTSPITSNTFLETKSNMTNLPENFNAGLSKLRPSQTNEMRFPASHTKTPKSSSLCLTSGLADTDARRQHEWQLEREAISKEIDSASPSKVIVIDSDDDGHKEVDQVMVEEHKQRISSNREGDAEDRAQTEGLQSISGAAEQTTEKIGQVTPQLPSWAGAERADQAECEGGRFEDDDGDIWLAEAKAGSSSPVESQQAVTAGFFTRPEQQRQRERAAEVINRPRRRLLPSPWKRGEDVEASTFVSNGETSGILWRQPQSPKFGAGEIVQTKRELSGSGNFDLERMLSSPVKLARSGRKASMELRIHRPNQDLNLIDGDEKEDENPVEDEGESVREGEENEGSPSFASEESMASSPPQPMRVPVNFNDSLVSPQTTPPPLVRSTPIEDTEERPPTPRSALKGARQTFAVAAAQESPRKVIFNERSMYLNENGEENSMSANLDSPQVEQPQPLDGQQEELEETEEEEEEVEEGQGQGQERPKKSGWVGWLWKGKFANESSRSDTSLTSEGTLQLDDITEPPAQDQQWQPTKTSMSSGPAVIQPESPQPMPKKQKSASTVPSYLKPPSYPSDPARLPATTPPLATSGDFSNSHFRTLHIIYAKSQRPRFHAPKHIRPAVRHLLGWRMELDLTDSGMDGFEWRADQTECEVVERFMQEVEWSHVQAGLAEKMVEVKWEWKVEELARRLGMIIIGEVVRREEGKR